MPLLERILKTFLKPSLLRLDTLEINETREVNTEEVLLELRPHYVLAVTSCTMAFHFFYVR